MTGQEIRDIGYLKWRDPLAWMENMKGKHWEQLLKREKQNYNSLLNQPLVTKTAESMYDELTSIQDFTKNAYYTIGCGAIIIFIGTTRKGLQWKWQWSKMLKICYDIDTIGNYVWYVTSSLSEEYKNLLVCEDANNNVIWKKEAVATQVAVREGKCYYIKVEEYFRTVELCVCDAITGKNNRILYRENDKGRDLLLIKATNKSLYLKSAAVSESKYWKIKDDILIEMDINSVNQIVLGESLSGDDCRLVSDKLGEWKIKGKPISDWIWPNSKEMIQWANINTGHLLTSYNGGSTIWYCQPHKKPQKLISIDAGSISLNNWSKWEDTIIQTFYIKTPFDAPHMVHIIGNKHIKKEYQYDIKKLVKLKELDIDKVYATSKDGTKVPYVIVKQKGIKPKGQLIYVYGSYGSQTPVGWTYQKWYPLLKRRWAIVFAFVRGGGDMNEEWIEAVRRENRYKSVDDFEAVIVASQKVLNLGPKQTVIYGRSAGGLPVGAIIARYPNGELVGAAFPEVPYVDVLRTSTNPDLPLTIGEYEEFGNPAARIKDFKALLNVSPINSLQSVGAPGVFVLDRVGLKDKQVFAYESFKWVQKLRGYNAGNGELVLKPNMKYIIFERNEAHHYNGKKAIEAMSTDYAILDAWIDGELNF